MKITGRVRLETSDGQVVEGENMVVNGGRDIFASLIADNTGTRPTHIALGTGTTPTTLTDITLENEQGRNAIASTSSSSAVVTWKAFYGKSDLNGNTISNAGLFNASSGVTMLAAFVLASTIAKTSSISITITWTLTLADT